MCVCLAYLTFMYTHTQTNKNNKKLLLKFNKRAFKHNLLSFFWCFFVLFLHVCDRVCVYLVELLLKMMMRKTYHQFTKKHDDDKDMLFWINNKNSVVFFNSTKIRTSREERSRVTVDKINMPYFFFYFIQLTGRFATEPMLNQKILNPAFFHDLYPPKIEA